MIKKTLLVIIVTIAVSCSPQTDKNQLTGNWYSCSDNGDYIEFLFKGNQYKYSSNFGMITSWCEYKISGDTLIQFDRYSIEDSLIINKALITIVNQDQIRIDYLTSDESWMIHKMNEEIDVIVSDQEMLSKTLERSKTVACEDKRTDEEKERDSINPFINFQF